MTIGVRKRRVTGRVGSSSVSEFDLQDVRIAMRSLTRAEELLKASVGAQERADALAHVRLAWRALGDVLGRQSAREAHDLKR